MEGFLENIHRAGLKFLEEMSLSQTYSLVLKEAIFLLKAECGAIYIYEDGNFNRKSAYPLYTDIAPPRKRGFVYRAYKERGLVIVNRNKIGTISPKVKNEKYNCSIYLPLTDHEKCTGIINLLLKEVRVFSKKEKDYLKLLASYGSLAIRKAKLLEDAREALSLRDQFISLAGHELRTPLTSINGYIQLLLMRMEGINNQESKWVKELAKESKRMTGLVTDLLEINRMKAGKFQFFLKDGKLSTSLEKAVVLLRTNFPEISITFRKEITGKNGSFIGDHTKLIEIFFRLAESMIKLSPSNRNILITLSNDKNNYYIEITRDRNGKYLPNGIPGDGKIPVNYAGFSMLLAKYIISFHHGDMVNFSREGEPFIRLRLPK